MEIKLTKDAPFGSQGYWNTVKSMTEKLMLNIRPGWYKAGVDAIAHIPAWIRISTAELGTVRRSWRTLVVACYHYLFEVTKMSIHCPINNLHQFKPLFSFNFSKGTNLSLEKTECYKLAISTLHLSKTSENQMNNIRKGGEDSVTKLKRACSNVDLAMWSSWNSSIAN